jgi:hypothetical protein
MLWPRITKNSLRLSGRADPRSRTIRPRCEQLEPRLQPAAFVFSTGNPDGKIATISEPANAHNSNVEYESADDFILPGETVITSATFTGLLTSGASPADISNVVVEIYRVFPKDSNVARTSGPPTFSTSAVPTRVNSPSDIALMSRDSAATLEQELTFTPSILSASFAAASSVSSAAKISVASGGDGPVSGVEVQFSVTFEVPLDLPADHYFFVPQVGLSAAAPAGAHFLWLSAPKPIQPPGTPFAPDLQSWMRDDPLLAPDWLRIGTDIIGGTTFNATFSVSGQIGQPFSFVEALFNDFLGRPATVPELSAWAGAIPSFGQATVANILIHSPEALTHLVDGLYVQLLGRSPVGGEEQGFVIFLEHGGTQAQVIQLIAGSAEFATHANTVIGGSNADSNFIQELFQVLLNRPPTGTETTSWVSLLPVLGHGGVAGLIVAGSEYRTDVITPLFTNLLDRTAPPAAAEVSGWVNTGLDLLTIEMIFASSGEYFANG